MRRLEAMHGYAPEQNLSVLRALPAGTLGREYARFLDANGIEPLVISPAVKESFRDNPYALRYTTTHDLHHVLTGFDTGLAGEAGVFAFNWVRARRRYGQRCSGWCASCTRCSRRARGAGSGTTSGSDSSWGRKPSS